MHAYTVYIWIGTWLFILPFLGIPTSWKEMLTILTGLFLIAHSLFLRKRNRRMEGVEAASDDGEKAEPARAGGDAQIDVDISNARSHSDTREL